MNIKHLCIGTGAAALLVAPAFADDHDEDEIPWDVAEVFFELNNTDGDLGIHALVDGGPWKRMQIEDAHERTIFTVRARGRLRRQGVTGDQADLLLDALAGKLEEVSSAKKATSAEIAPRGAVPPVQVHVHRCPDCGKVEAAGRSLGRADTARLACDAAVSEPGRRNTTTIATAIAPPIAIITAFSILVMIGAAALTVHFGHAHSERSRLQSAVDASALAAASMLSGPFRRTSFRRSEPGTYSATM